MPSDVQYISSFNAADPRIRALRGRVPLLRQAGYAGDDLEAELGFYYDAEAGIDRSNETTAPRYHAAIEGTIAALQPTRIKSQRPDQDIAAADIDGHLTSDSMDFVHVWKVQNVGFLSRLYVPANLKFISGLLREVWSYDAVLKLKVIGFDGARNRADVIVAWCQHRDHARAIGMDIDATRDHMLSGVNPVGSFACSNKNLCGWALEYGSSVSTDVIAAVRDGKGPRTFAVPPTL